ncbi:MAG: hypothetical protein ACE5I9_00880 [Candidatus Methylomirabilales bacterium]
MAVKRGVRRPAFPLRRQRGTLLLALSLFVVALVASPPTEAGPDAGPEPPRRLSVYIQPFNNPYQVLEDHGLRVEPENLVSVPSGAVLELEGGQQVQAEIGGWLASVPKPSDPEEERALLEELRGDQRIGFAEPDRCRAFQPEEVPSGGAGAPRGRKLPENMRGLVEGGAGPPRNSSGVLISSGARATPGVRCCSGQGRAPLLWRRDRN